MQVLEPMVQMLELKGPVFESMLHAGIGINDALINAAGVGIIN